MHARSRFEDRNTWNTPKIQSKLIEERRLKYQKMTKKLHRSYDRFTKLHILRVAHAKYQGVVAQNRTMTSRYTTNSLCARPGRTVSGRVLRNEISNKLYIRIIDQAQWEWSSPIFLTPKKTESSIFRGLQELNIATVGDLYVNVCVDTEKVFFSGDGTILFIGRQ